MIPYARHSIDDEDIEAVVRVLKSDRVAQGPVVQDFERALVEVSGFKYAVAVSSGTAALEIACSIAFKPEDRILLPPITFVATANAVLRTRAQPCFVDVERDTLNIDPAAVAMRTRESRVSRILPIHGIVGVDFAGLPCNVEALGAIARDRGLRLVIDAAHSFGLLRPHREVVAACTSFHPSKAITTGEGGAVLTDRPEVAAAAQSLRDHGRSAGECTEPSSNYRMPEMSAALGLSQRRKLDRFLTRRSEIAERYFEGLVGTPGLQLPISRQSTWHLFVVRVDPGRRDEVREALQARGIGTQVHYRPVYEHPAYLEARSYHGCPVAEKESKRLISLPIFPAMTDEDVATVIRAVREVV